MVFEDDVNEFKQWAIRMGCPSEIIPNQKSLEKIFQSKESLPFQNMMRRVRPKQEVEEIRQNILINNVDSFKGVISKSTRENLPSQMQNYITIKNLKQEKNCTKKIIDEIKSEVGKVRKTITAKNNEIQYLKQKFEAIEIQSNVFYSKQKKYLEDLKTEQKISQKIREIMPVAFNDNVDNADMALDKCKKVFKEFYENSEGNDSEQSKNEHLWIIFRQIFANVPNFLLWKNLECRTEDQLNKLSGFVGNIENVSIENPNNCDGLTSSAFIVALHRANAENIKLCLERKQCQKEIDLLTNEFVSLYDEIEQNADKALGFQVSEKYDENIINEFLTALSLSSCYKAQCENAEKTIEMNEKRLLDLSTKLENHKHIIASLQENYDQIELLILKTREDIELMKYAKDKIKHCESYSKCLMENDQQNYLANGSQVNSFNSMSDSVLCSTKLDFENSIRSDIRTPRSIMPQHINEIKLLADVPFVQLCQMTAENTLLLTNRIVLHHSAQAIFDFTSMPQIILKQMENKLSFYGRLKCITPAKTSLEFPSVNTNEIQKQHRDILNDIEKNVDEINRNYLNANKIIENIHTNYEFLTSNPLRRYVPKTQLFNNRTLEEYEHVYWSYYSTYKSNRNNP